MLINYLGNIRNIVKGLLNIVMKLKCLELRKWLLHLKTTKLLQTLSPMQNKCLLKHSQVNCTANSDGALQVFMVRNLWCHYVTCPNKAKYRKSRTPQFLTLHRLMYVYISFISLKYSVQMKLFNHM